MSVMGRKIAERIVVGRKPVQCMDIHPIRGVDFVVRMQKTPVLKFYTKRKGGEHSNMAKTSKKPVKKVVKKTSKKK